MLDPAPPPASPRKTRGRRKKTAGPDTEERLIAAAASAFGRLGYERTRLADVAQEAGITRPSLLHHFSSKRALYEATLSYAFDRLKHEVVEALLVDGDYDQRVTRLLEVLIGFDAAHRAMLATIFRGVLRDDDDVTRAKVREAFIPLVDRMESFIRFGAGDRMPADYPLRQAVLSLIVTQLTHSALGEFGTELWKGEPKTLRLSQAMMLVGVRPATTPAKSLAAT